MPEKTGRTVVLLTHDDLREALRLPEDVTVVAVVPDPVIGNVRVVLESPEFPPVWVGEEEPPVAVLESLQESRDESNPCQGRDPAYPGTCPLPKGHPGGCFGDPHVDG